MELNNKIKTIRESKHINQAVVASELNITVQAYSMKEMGKRRITTDELVVIAKVLREPIAKFFN
jgi:transcriptional regulator with XRE-family HTH domain